MPTTFSAIDEILTHLRGDIFDWNQLEHGCDFRTTLTPSPHAPASNSHPWSHSTHAQLMSTLRICASISSSMARPCVCLPSQCLYAKWAITPYGRGDSGASVRAKLGRNTWYPRSPAAVTPPLLAPPDLLRLANPAGWQD